MVYRFLEILGEGGLLRFYRDQEHGQTVEFEFMQSMVVFLVVQRCNSFAGRRGLCQPRFLLAGLHDLSSYAFGF